jgi:hypothetical protein
VTEELLLREIQTLRLQPGDVLLLRPTHLMTADTLRRMSEVGTQVGERVGIKVMVIDSQLEVVGVVRPEGQG